MCMRFAAALLLALAVPCGAAGQKHPAAPRVDRASVTDDTATPPLSRGARIAAKASMIARRIDLPHSAKRSQATI